MVSLGTDLAIKDSTGRTPLDILQSRTPLPCCFECTRIKYNDNDCIARKGLPYEPAKVEELLVRVSYNWHCHSQIQQQKPHFANVGDSMVRFECIPYFKEYSVC